MRRTPILHDLAKIGWSHYKRIQGRYRLKQSVKKMSPVKIVIGASGVFDDTWIPTDVDYLNLLIPKHWEKCFRKNSIDALLAEHVWEHLTPEEGLTAARHCYQYLRPGGYLRVAVPDGFHPDDDYIEWVKKDGRGPGSDNHKVLYTYKTLRSLFEEAGFIVELLEYFDSEGKFHFVDWDVGSGKIKRSKRFDERNRNGKLRYTSIILDAYKMPR